MKLPDFTEYQPFNALRQKMGADQLGYFTLIELLSKAEKATLATTGIEFSSLDEIKVLKDQTLAYKNSRVLLYIRDVSIYHSKHQGIQDLPRFHVSDCKTIQHMRENKRFARYVVSTRTDGMFEIRRIGNNGNSYKSYDIGLLVCKNCLNNLNFNGYSSSWIKRDQIFKSFKLNDYFYQYPKSPIINVPLYTNKTAPTNQYSQDGHLIYTKLKENCNWTCQAQKCGVQISNPQMRSFIHAHHINGQKNDNRQSNLFILCIKCHAEKPFHSHLKLGKPYQDYMKIYKELRSKGAAN